MQLSKLSWPEVEKLDRDTPVLIPIAAVEQHGHHLPLFTDSLLLGEILRRAESELGSNALVAPLQWYGNSHHHMDFPGTLSAPPRVFLDLVSGMIENFIDHGFRRILLLNGHGGNDIPGKQAMFELRQQHRSRADLLLLFATYWSLADSPQASIPDLQQTQMQHACEWETSMMLVFSPELVGDYKSVVAVDPGNPFRPASRSWITKDRSEAGHIGMPNMATREKGEALLSHFASGLLSMIQRMNNWDGQSWDG